VAYSPKDSSEDPIKGEILFTEDFRVCFDCIEGCESTVQEQILLKNIRNSILIVCLPSGEGESIIAPPNNDYAIDYYLPP
jgi:hypothetical protein